MKKWLSKHYLFLIFISVSVFVRVWNYQEAMYFIYDVGRDVTVLKEILHGDLKLTGPTTGIPGVFLGPMWYYLGLPGYLITNGNPYLIQLWYIMLSSLSLPLYWILCKKLFPKPWFVVAALLLSLTPGGFSGTNFVWNPMLALPLMTGALIAFFYSRKSSLSLYLGFLLLSLTLQAEFAYAVFFVVAFWFISPWLMGKFSIKKLATITAVIALTLFPQIIFELTHNFSMTKSLIQGMNEQGKSVSLPDLWKIRPTQLWNATQAFFVRSDTFQKATVFLLVASWLTAAVSIIKSDSYRWKLVLLMALLPYVFYMFWTGNYGFFFDYYITSHFIFLVLLCVYGCLNWVKLAQKIKLGLVAYGVSIFLFSLLFCNGYIHLDALVFRPINNGGILKMEQAINTLYDWSLTDQQRPAVFRIYTPNLSTESYDYMSWWLAKTKNYQQALTVQSESDVYRYVAYEPDEHIRETRFLPWYRQATANMLMLRQEKIGILTLETWQKQ